MTSRFIDFDAARAEREHEPLILRAYGKTFELPEKMPANIYLDVLRMELDKGKDADVSIADSMQLMRRVLPSAILDELLEQPDFSLEDLADLTSMVMQAYQGVVPVPLAPSRATKRHPPKFPPSPGFRAGSTGPKALIQTPEPGETSSQTGAPSSVTSRSDTGSISTPTV